MKEELKDKLWNTIIKHLVFIRQTTTINKETLVSQPQNAFENLNSILQEEIVRDLVEGAKKHITVTSETDPETLSIMLTGKLVVVKNPEEFLEKIRQILDEM